MTHWQLTVVCKHMTSISSHSQLTAWIIQLFYIKKNVEHKACETDTLEIIIIIWYLDLLLKIFCLLYVDLNLRGFIDVTIFRPYDQNTDINL